jgi:hypothetical protein
VSGSRSRFECEDSDGCWNCGLGCANEQSERDDDSVFCVLWEDYHDDADVCEDWERKQ